MTAMDRPDRESRRLWGQAHPLRAGLRAGGFVAAGFGKTAAALEHEKVAGLLHAAEAASDGIRKLDALMRRRFSGKAPAVVRFLTSAQLDLALSRPNVIHAALLAGPASETVLARCRRLERFRTGDPPPKAAEAAPDLAGEGTERV